MTEKDFLDVFPQLKVDPELESLLGEVKVMKVSINPQKDCLRVYVLSRQWIHKKHIYHLEETIKEQFFANAPLRVKIIEKFQLSSQYTPGKFSGCISSEYSAGIKAVQRTGVQYVLYSRDYVQ